MLYKSENTFALLRSTAFTYLMLILFDIVWKKIIKLFMMTIW